MLAPYEIEFTKGNIYMAEYLLPKLSQNAAIVPTTSGQWESKSITADELNNLANGLEVAQGRNRPTSIDSIPDVWARPIFFKMALYASTGNHFDAELHRKIKGEWRAILAMLALKDARHLNITVDHVNLGDGGAIENTLLTLAPKDSATGNVNDWQNIYVISYNGKTLAITSPTTLISAAADYSTELAGQITAPWSRDGKYLADPVPNLTPVELSGLQQWLGNLLRGLHNYIPPDVQITNATCQKLFETLQDYLDDVNGRLRAHPVAAGIGVIPAGLGMPIGISQYLDYKVQVPPPNPANSTVLLQPSRSSTPLLILSPEMLDKISTHYGINKHSLFVLPGLTADNVNDDSLNGNRQMIGNVSIAPAQWRRPEEFFTDNLAVFRNPQVFKCVRQAHGSDNLSAQNLSVILPLKKEILEYLAPEEIIQRFHIERVGADFKVTFNFPLHGVDGRPMNYTAEKRYTAGKIFLIGTAIPVIEMWPNFKRENWNKYYLYYENVEAQNNVHSVGKDFFYVYPYAYGKNIAGQTPTQGLQNLYAARLFGFPEALICTLNWTNNGMEPAHYVDVGFLILEEPKTVPVNFGTNWNVGIDFGTSSTMLYKKVNDNRPSPLELQPNLFQVTNSGDLRNRTYRNFIPSSTEDQQAGSFLSIFQMLKPIVNGVPINPLQDGNIYWLLSADGPDAEDFRNNTGNITANLKWSSDTAGKMKVTAYIQQICLQILAEAAQNGVNELSWNFSYPTAFSATQQSDFINACQMAVDDALLDTGFLMNTPITDRTESEASAYYFSNVGGAKLAGGSICLDIGAGTTDLSVVSGAPAKIVYHTSLPFAGRHLFRSIYKNYSLFANTQMTFGAMNEEQKNSLIDADIRKKSNAYLRNLVHITGKQDVEKALQIAQFATAGIFYYLGGLIGLLHSVGIYQEDTIPKIYIGGNGARIFSWICGGNLQPRSINLNPRMSVLNTVFNASSGLNGIFSIFLSHTPKAEVAQGMVDPVAMDGGFVFFDKRAIANSIFGDQGADQLIADSVFAGETFFLKNDSNPHKKTEFISAYDIKNGVTINDVQELDNFVAKFNSDHNIWSPHNKVTINARQRNDVKISVLGAYNSQIGRAEDQIFVEPVFILELKKFVEMLCP